MGDKLIIEPTRQTPIEAVRQIIAGLLAPFVAFGVFYGLVELISQLPPGSLAKGPIILLVPVLFGLALGLGFYLLASPASSRRKLVSIEDSPAEKPNVWPLRIWWMGFALQACLYVGLSFILQFEIRVVAEQYRFVFWYSYNGVIYFAMLVSLVSMFWIFRNIADRITFVFWCGLFFAALYSVFLLAVKFYSSPVSVPFKLSGG